MFQLKSVSEMRNEELMSFKLKWSFHIIRIKLKYDSHSHFSGQKKSRLSHRPDSQDHLDRFKLLDVKHESNQPGCDRTDRVINISKWGDTHVIWDLMRWAVRTVYHARRELGVQGVMCYVLPGPVCLLSIPQPPLFDLSRCAAPAPAHRDGHWSHHVTHETRGTGRGVTPGISPVTRIQIVMNGSQVVACSRDGVLRAWQIICDVVTALATRVWRKQDRSDQLIYWVDRRIKIDDKLF